MPAPPPFPFRRAGRVIYSSRGLFGWAAFIVMIVALIGGVVYRYAGTNSTTGIVVACCFLGVLLAMAGWCIYWGRRVKRWEHDYEHVMGRKFDA